MKLKLVNIYKCHQCPTLLRRRESNPGPLQSAGRRYPLDYPLDYDGRFDSLVMFAGQECVGMSVMRNFLERIAVRGRQRLSVRHIRGDAVL